MTTEKTELDIEQGDFPERKVNKVRRNFIKLFIGIFLIWMAAICVITAVEQNRELSQVVALFGTQGYSDNDLIVEIKRDDKSNSNDDTTDSNATQDDANSDPNAEKPKQSAAQKALKQPGIQAALAVGAFIVLNMFVILVHHIIQRLSNTDKLYRNVEQHISPF